MDFGIVFSEGLGYADFLRRYGTQQQRRRWQSVHDQVRLSREQIELLSGFTREMKVIVTAGTWCGDCANQCPILDHFSAANERIQIRFFDRDDESELAEELSICGAPRVPSVLFLSEDDHVCGRYGDRTLSEYRRMAREQTGAACPTGIESPDGSVLESVTREWLDEFERIQWMLRTSTRLRALHGD